MVAQLQLAADAYRAILESLPTGVYLVDRDRRIVFWNDGCERITGHFRHEVIGRCCGQNLLMHCDARIDDMCGAACPLQATMHDGRPREAHVFLRHRNGQRVPVLVRAVPIRDEKGTVIGACESFDERPFSLPAAPLVHIGEPYGFPDEVTGLVGRPAILERLQIELEKLQSSCPPFGVLCLGIDHPDRLRAADGSIGMNQVLYATAQTLAANVGPGNLAGRWSDWKFIVILRGCTADNLLESANFLKRLAGLEAVPWWGDSLSVTLSVGGSLARPEDTGESLVERAEKALDQSMQIEGNRAVVV
jgi:PAS domain S-box-containing protein/diguanylate cyclase (GGDEF)-like protein